ncbi:hypothetical protein GCM10010251_51950 [Streptomyces aurantiogriseus]|uniref:Transposase n=1 Tax=Streptomyces aurantiogriseus TaxID=66870 RepID=A0A918FEF3_9ACTN|nr:hypothetical protein GCM10010251_51950 [Streptomyces aurantiogriseus]
MRDEIAPREALLSTARYELVAERRRREAAADPLEGAQEGTRSGHGKGRAREAGPADVMSPDQEAVM